MSHAGLIAADLAAVVVIAFALYFPRHRRRDMVVAILGINIGVLAVATVLSESTVTAGLGLGTVRCPVDHPPSLTRARPGGGGVLFLCARLGTPRWDHR